MERENRKCTLLVAEMSLNTLLNYHRGKDVVEGLVDHGMLDRSPDRANSVLVFMSRSIRRKWEQPMVFFFTKLSTLWTKLYNILLSLVLTMYSKQVWNLSVSPQIKNRTSVKFSKK